MHQTVNEFIMQYYHCSMRSVATYRDILRKKGIRYSLHEGWKAIWPIRWTQSKAIKDLIAQDRAYKYLQRYARYAQDYAIPTSNVPKHIWICWLQGIDSAPATVQLCFDSVQRFANDFEITLLNAENMLNYVTLPEDILEKYRMGRIPFAQFSDILRVSLLAQHGGIWMDATVLMTGSMPEYVTSSNLFMFRGSWLQPGQTVASNWFLASAPQHPIMCNMQNLLIAYWQNETYLRDYYIFHILLKILVEQHEQSRNLFQSMTYQQNVDVHTLMFRAASEPYSEQLKKDIQLHSTIHKLSYKNGIDYSMYI